MTDEAERARRRLLTEQGGLEGQANRVAHHRQPEAGTPDWDFGLCPRCRAILAERGIGPQQRQEANR